MGTRTAAVYEFEMYIDDLQSGTVLKLQQVQIRLRNPGTLADFISTTVESNLLICQKCVGCKLKCFLAPWQRMSVVEGRERIVNYIKKMAQ